MFNFILVANLTVAIVTYIYVGRYFALQMYVAIGYAAVLPGIAFFFLYWTCYVACSNDSSARYTAFFVNYGIGFLFNICMAGGFPICGSVGLISAGILRSSNFYAIAYSHYAVFGLWTLNALYMAMMMTLMCMNKKFFNVYFNK